MSLPMKALDRLFERLALTYGAQWTRMWQDMPMTDVKTAWGDELAVFAGSLNRVAWALENLPARCPNVIEFKNLCRQAPMPDAPRLPAPKADPERLRLELSKLEQLRVAVVAGEQIDHKAWAKAHMRRHLAGDKLRPITLRFSREALGLPASGVGDREWLDRQEATSA